MKRLHKSAKITKKFFTRSNLTIPKIKNKIYATMGKDHKYTTSILLTI